MSFGRWLKRQIEKRLVTQREFSRQTGIPLPTLERWLGRARPAIRGTNLERLAAGLEMSRESIERRLQRSPEAVAA